VASEAERNLGGVGVGRNFRWSRKEFYVESESEGICRWSRSRKEFVGGVGVGRNFRWSRSRKEFYVESESEGVLCGVGRNF
jgi:hypothetical protein